MAKSGQPSKKVMKTRTKLTASKCRNVITKLQRVDGIPDSLREDLAKQACVLLGKRAQKLRVSESEAVTALTEAAEHVREALQTSLVEAHAKIKEADFDKRARESARTDAEANLERLKQAITDERKIVSNLTKFIETKRKAIQTAKTAQTKATAELKAAESKKRSLESVEKDAFGPLKEAFAEGSEGQKRLGVLRRVGKEYGFHSEMMNVMPAVLKKEIDRRQTFDGLVVQYLGVEFARHTDALDLKVKERGSHLTECSSMVQEAHTDLRTAKEEHKAHTRALADAEKALADAKATLLQAKRHSQAFPSDMGKTLRDLSLAKTRVDKFQRGALAALEEVLPAPVDCALRVSHDID